MRNGFDLACTRVVDKSLTIADAPENKSTASAYAYSDLECDGVFLAMVIYCNTKTVSWLYDLQALLPKNIYLAYQEGVKSKKKGL